MADSKRLRLLIAEDYEVLREAFALFFSEYIEVVGKTGDSSQTLILCQQLQPDMVLLSSNLYPVDILSFIRRLGQQYPAAQIVVLASLIDPTPRESYLDAGVSRVVTKGTFASDLLTMMLDVYYQN